MIFIKISFKINFLFNFYKNKIIIDKDCKIFFNIMKRFNKEKNKTY